MVLEAPPSRYRVVERGGRLTVIDTQGDGTVRSARDLIARDAAARRVAIDDAPGVPADHLEILPLSAPMALPRPQTAGPSDKPPATGTRRPLGQRADVAGADRLLAASPPRAFSRNDPLTQPPGLLRSVAAAVAGNARDDAGRLLLTTARWYDAKAVRTVALEPAAETRIGVAVLAAAFALLVTLGLFLSGEPAGWVLAVLAFVGVGQVKPVVTRQLDRLASG